MKKNSKKNLLITFIILIISILVFIKIFSDSSAKKETKIDVKFIDDEKLLQDEEMQLDPIKEDSKYYVILPEIVNEKKVDSFVIGNNENSESNSKIQDNNKNNSNNNSSGEKSTISNTNLSTGTNLNENTKSNDKNEKQNSNANSNNKNENNNEKTDNKKSSTNANASGAKSSTDSNSNGTKENADSDANLNKTNSNTDANFLKPGDKVLLDELQIRAQKLEIKVKYQKKQKDNKTLYNKQIEKVIDKNADNKKIIIEGFMPLDSKISVKVVEDKEKQNLVLKGKDENTTLKAIYDIKILSEGKEYEPTDFDENVSVKIEGIDTTDKENKKYRVIHIDNNNIAKEVTNVDTENNTISFNANSFSEYAVLEENSTSSTPSKWDGTVGTKYVYGDGSKEKPYLISNGKELAYLREQVNNGNSYNGKYFSVVSDIDL